MAQQQVVYIIINTIPPYAYEINNILGLPDGARYRARFRKKWHPDVADPDDLQGQDAIIVLRIWDTAKLIPMRRVHIDSIDPWGDTSYIKYTLASLIEYDSNETTRTEQLDEFNEKIARELDNYPNEEKTNLQKLVFQAPDLTVEITDSHSRREPPHREYDNWARIVGLVGNSDPFLEIDFIKVMNVVDERGNYQPLVDSPTSKRYRLRSNKTYYLQIFQRTRTNLPPGNSAVTKSRTIKLSTEAEVMKLINDAVVITGKYDLYEFSLRTAPLNHMRDLNIALDINRADDIVIPTIEVPVRVTLRPVKLVVQIFALVVFISAVLFLTFRDQLTGTVFANYPELLQTLAIVALVISAFEIRQLLELISDNLDLDVLTS